MGSRARSRSPERMRAEESYRQDLPRQAVGSECDLESKPLLSRRLVHWATKDVMIMRYVGQHSLSRANLLRFNHSGCDRLNWRCTCRTKLHLPKSELWQSCALHPHHCRGRRRSCRSCQRLMKSSAQVAPIRAMNISSCVSQISPWVPRNARAAWPEISAVTHSSSS
jgi:hypothetical protein